jgi:DNA-binding CsgD family transcriptional regulator
VFRRRIQEGVATVVKDAHLFSREREIDLSRLNETERRVLRLLAEGHTAKSIASELGTTPAAVNERLREARRKTGAGSSRELARLLKSQENRHEQMGMARVRSTDAALLRTDAESWRPQTGAFAMIVLFVIAAAGAAALMSQQSAVPKGELPATKQIVDPQLGTIVTVGATWLYPMLREEQRDPQWAPRAERVLRQCYSAIEFFGEKPDVLRITCARTLCEVAASFGAPRPHSSYTEKPSFYEDTKKAGLVHTGSAITTTGNPPHGIYLAYYVRSRR